MLFAHDSGSGVASGVHPRCIKAPLFFHQIKLSGQPDTPQDNTLSLAWRRDHYGLVAAPCEPSIEAKQSQSCVSCAKSKYKVGPVSHSREDGPHCGPSTNRLLESSEHHFRIVLAQVVQESILPTSRLWHRRHLRGSISVGQKIHLYTALEDSRRSRAS